MIATTPSIKQLSDGVELSTSVSGKPVSAKFHYAWLRDHCPCPMCVHEHNRQKLHSSADINIDVVPQSVRILPTSPSNSKPSIEIIWPKGSLKTVAGQKGHTSLIPVDWLINNSYQRSLKPLRSSKPEPLLWTAEEFDERSVRVHYDEYMTTSSGLLKVLTQLRDFGLAFLTNVPTESGKEVEGVARRIGCIRETFYGTSWDVKS
ncbi:hypothetical protein HDU67_003664, partial [Dinochytrium kinnereticum]